MTLYDNIVKSQEGHAGRLRKRRLFSHCFAKCWIDSPAIFCRMQKPSRFISCSVVALTATVWTASLSYADESPAQSSSKQGMVTSNHTFYGKKAEGWFFYNEKYDKKKKKVEKKKSPVAKAQPQPKKEPLKTPVKPIYSGPPPLSSAWLKVNLPKYLNKALDDPSPQNVRAYLILQKVALDKSERFTDMSKRVSVTDPVLDELTRRPFASSGVNVAAAVASMKGENEMKKMGKTMGLWVFYKDSAHCPYCNLVGQLLSAQQRLYGFKVLPISLDGTPPPPNFPVANGYRLDHGQAKKMNVVATPAIYLVNIPKKEDISVGQGSSMSLPELKSRILLAALQKHWITNDEYAQAMPNNNTNLLSDSDKILKTTDKDGFVDPADVVKFVEKSFGKVR